MPIDTDNLESIISFLRHADKSPKSTQWPDLEMALQGLWYNYRITGLDEDSFLLVAHTLYKFYQLAHDCRNKEQKNYLKNYFCEWLDLLNSTDALAHIHDPKTIAKAFYYARRFNVPPNMYFTIAALSRLENLDLTKLDPDHMTELLAGLKSLGCDTKHQIFSDLQSAVITKLKQQGAKPKLALMIALTDLNTPIMLELGQVLLADFDKTPDVLEKHQFCNFMAALQKMRLHPDPVLRDWIFGNISDYLPKLNSYNLEDTMTSLANLCLVPYPELSLQLQDRCAQCLPDFSDDSAISVLRAISIFDLIQPGIWPESFKLFANRVANINPQGPKETRIYYFLRTLHPDYLPEQPNHAIRTTSNTISYLERKFVKYLPASIKKAYDIKRSVNIEGVTTVDLTLTPKDPGKPNIAMLIDGPIHFIQQVDGTSATYSGGTLLMTQFLAKVLAATTLVRIHFDAVNDGSARQHLPILLEDVGKMPQKIFAVGPGGNLRGFDSVAAMAAYRFNRTERTA